MDNYDLEERESTQIQLDYMISCCNTSGIDCWHHVVTFRKQRFDLILATCVSDLALLVVSQSSRS